MNRWQHVIPQREQDHEVNPAVVSKVRARKIVRVIVVPQVCDTCGEKIKRVPENDGPEGLKALLRF